MKVDTYVNHLLMVFDLDTSDLARLMGFSYHTVLNWKQGKSFPRRPQIIDTLQTLSEWLSECFEIPDQRDWAKSPNPMLNGLTPRDYIFKAGLENLVKKIKY